MRGSRDTLLCGDSLFQDEVGKAKEREIKEPRVNRKIRATEVRLIDDEGEQQGIVPTRQALEMAEEAGLDLVEVAPQAKPPVCKLMDYGKYKYLQKQKEKDSRRNSTHVQVKEVKLRPKTDDHDVQTKVRHIRRFLAAGDKAKVTVMFRGREITHKDRGFTVLERVMEELEEEANVEMRPKMEGRTMIMILAPKPAAKVKKKDSSEDDEDES